MQLRINLINEPMISVSPTDTKFIKVTDRQGNLLGNITVEDIRTQLYMMEVINILDEQ